MAIDTTRIHDSQVEAVETTVTMPDGKTMVFVQVGDRHYIGDTSNYYDGAKYQAGIAKLTAQGATLAARSGYVFP